MEELEQKLIKMICRVCRIQEPLPNIDPTAPLLGPDSVLGIDSLDAVEIIFTIQNEYKVRIGSEETSREILTSLQSLATFIKDNQ